MKNGRPNIHWNLPLVIANSGEPSRARTCDPLIKSQLLYQLSYRPVCLIAGKIIRAKKGVSSKPALKLARPLARDSTRRQMKTLLCRGGALGVGKQVVDSGDQRFDIWLRDVRGGAGGHRFTTVNLVGVAGVEDARHSRSEQA